MNQIRTRVLGTVTSIILRFTLNDLFDIIIHIRNSNVRVVIPKTKEMILKHLRWSLNLKYHFTIDAVSRSFSKQDSRWDITRVETRKVFFERMKLKNAHQRILRRVGLNQFLKG